MSCSDTYRPVLKLLALKKLNAAFPVFLTHLFLTLSVISMHCFLRSIFNPFFQYFEAKNLNILALHALNSSGIYASAFHSL